MGFVGQRAIVPCAKRLWRRIASKIKVMLVYLTMATFIPLLRGTIIVPQLLGEVCSRIALAVLDDTAFSTLSFLEPEVAKCWCVQHFGKCVPRPGSGMLFTSATRHLIGRFASVDVNHYHIGGFLLF